jgi:hypothetical protein
MKVNTIQIMLFALIVLMVTKPLAAQEPEEVKEKQAFFEAKKELSDMLSGKQALDYERAVFVTENAYYNNTLKYEGFKKFIDYNQRLVEHLISEKQSVKVRPHVNYYISPDSLNENVRRLKANYAIYQFMTDTNLFIIDSSFVVHYPFYYSKLDPFGTTNWKNNQVINLLSHYKGYGNCNALSTLFKILSERLHSGAKICTSQGHIFLEVEDENLVPFNVEIASRAFPGSGSIQVLTHTTDEAAQSGISMRSLDLKQSIGLCLINLAKSYQSRFNCTGDAFMLDCAELALKHDVKNLNAMLLKAEMLENTVISMNKPFDEVKHSKAFITYQNYLTQLYDLGYREMPIEMKNVIIASLTKDENFHPALINKTNHPFKNNGVYNGISLSGGAFEEMNTFKPELKYFRTLYDAKKKQIKCFTEKDKLYNNYDFDPVASALQVDPHTSRYPNISPYAAFNNNPISFTDPDGRDAIGVIKGNTITVNTVIYINNSGTNKMNVAETQKAIMKYWGKDFSYSDGKNTYKVKFNITVKEISPNKTDNPVDEGTNLVRAADENFRSYTAGKWYGVWAKNQTGAVYAHEVGHMLGLADQYADLKNNAGNMDISGHDGEEESVSYSGAAKDELMAAPGNGVEPSVSQKDINALMGYILSNQKDGKTVINMKNLIQSLHGLGLAKPTSEEQRNMMDKAEKEHKDIVDHEKIN